MDILVSHHQHHHSRHCRLHHQVSVLERVDCTMHWINHYPPDNSINFDSTFSPDSDLSSG